MTTLEDLRILNDSFCIRESWFRDGLYWRDNSGDWVIDVYGSNQHGRGDLISNTMMKIMQEGDRSEWAYKSLEVCKNLLIERRRWPTRMDHPNDAKNMLDKWWSDFDNWNSEGRVLKKFRTSGGMTRDPYTFFYAACVMMGKEEWIAEVKMPWYCWRPGVWAWRKTLYKRNWWNNFLYREKGSHELFYVTRLRAFRSYAYHNTYSD